MNERLLAIYLNDHLAGATLGVELTRRALRNNRGNEFGDFLERLLADIEADRRTLEQVIVRLGVPRSRAKIGLAWAAEKLGRLKLNGRLVRYSPLSRLAELEGLSLGVAGKAALWRSLDLAAKGDPRLVGFDFASLADHAESQRADIERFRVDAARIALGEANGRGAR